EAEPPGRSLTPRQWLRVNLFSTPANAALTVVVGLALAWLVFRLGRWAFVTADWAVVRQNLRLFMVGRFPVDDLWRLWVAGYIAVAALGVGLGAVTASARRPLDTDGDGEAPTRSARSPLRRARMLLQRFWPAVSAIVVVLAFTRTPLPALGTVG